MREIIIIKENTQNILKIKSLLEKEHINYETYQEKVNVFANYDKVLQDKEREKEAQELENGEQEDIINEEW